MAPVVSTTRRPVVTAIVFAVSAYLGDAKGFSLSKINPGKIKDSVEKVAQQKIDEVKNKNVDDVMEEVKAESSKQLKQAKSTFEDLKDTSAKEASNALKAPEAQGIEDALKGAASAITKGVDVINNSTAETLTEKVADATESAKATMNKAAEDVTDTKDLAKEVTTEMKANASKMAGVVNSTGHSLAEAIAKGAESAAESGFLKTKGFGASTEDDLSGEATEAETEVQGESMTVLFAALGGFALLFLLGGFAYRSVRSQSARSLTGLLADADHDMQFRGGSIQQEATNEPFFQQF